MDEKEPPKGKPPPLDESPLARLADLFGLIGGLHEQEKISLDERNDLLSRIYDKLLQESFPRTQFTNPGQSLYTATAIVDAITASTIRQITQMHPGIIIGTLPLHR